MQPHPVGDQSSLLAMCALLPHFDRALLEDLSAVEPGMIVHLLDSQDVCAHPDQPGQYRLIDTAAQTALDWLAREQSDGQIALHRHVLDVLAAWLRERPAGAQPMREDLFIQQLDRLFFLLATKLEWETLRTLVAAAADLPLAQRRNHQRLAFFDAYIAIRLHEFTQGEAKLNELLTQDDLEPDVRLKALRGLGFAALTQTHYDRALRLHTQVQAYANTIGDHIYAALGLLDRGLTQLELEEYRLALLDCLKSLRIFRRHHEALRGVNALYHAGLCSLYLGRWKKAEQYIAQAAQLYAQHNMALPLAFTSWMRGYLQHLLGDETASEAFFLHTLSITEAAGNQQRSLAMDAYLSLGFLYTTQGHTGRALRQFRHALLLAEQLGQQHRRCQIHFYRGRALQRQGRHNAALLAYRAAIESIEALGSAMEGEDVKISLFGTTQQLYEAMVLLLLDLGLPQEAFHYVERARSRAFLDALAKKSPELSASLESAVLTLAEVQAQLPQGALLLEYFTTGVRPRGEHFLNSIPETNRRLREQIHLPAQVIIFAITRDHFQVHRPKLNPNDLQPALGDRYPGRHLLHGRLPQYLYQRFIAPAEELLAESDLLYLVPHGPLHYVPFSALRSAAGDYLLDWHKPALALAPSATILLRNCLSRPAADGTGGLAIGFNDPQGPQPLRFAEAEARHIARMLGGKAWTGRRPKSQLLAAKNRKLRWLHIAGHARFNPRDPLGSALLLGQGDELDARTIIRELDLDVDLVTLSSCTSGVTHVVPGDELRGLQRALLYAGAPTVVCTRWEARDLVTLIVMDYFYNLLRQGCPPALALRDAQVSVRELTSQQIEALFERWRLEGNPLAATLGGPEQVLDYARSATSDMEPVQPRSAPGQWRNEASDRSESWAQAAIQPDRISARPFADPLLWAPYMLVGRA